MMIFMFWDITTRKCQHFRVTFSLHLRNVALFSPDENSAMSQKIVLFLVVYVRLSVGNY
jgi:hypothetical protein